jgi:hypothetical protein
MFRISRFHDVLKSLPRGVFDRQVAGRDADKHCKVSMSGRLPVGHRVPKG